MRFIPCCAVAALTAGLAAPVLAQTSSTTTTVRTSPTTTVTTNVQSASGVPVASGAGLVIVPGTPVANQQLLPGGSYVQSNTTQVMGAPGTTTTVKRYWVNVPPSVVTDMDFQRWQALR